METILTELITRSSLPMRALEGDFALDSTGCGSTRFSNWITEKYGEIKDGHDWVKVHISCGVVTNIVAAVQIGERNAHDSPFFPALLKKTAENFDIRHVVADKAYSSRENYKLADEMGIVPYIPFRNNSKPDPVLVRKRTESPWNRMYHLYSLHREDFLTHYHVRSNVESTFMAIKAKFGERVRSKTFLTQKNEVLCKILCHNICCVIQSMHEFGIDAEFGKAA
jgi:transposase